MLFLFIQAGIDAAHIDLNQIDDFYFRLKLKIRSGYLEF
jgi:hypothetical protein